MNYLTAQGEWNPGGYTYNGEENFHRMLKDRDATIQHLGKLLTEAQEKIRTNRRLIIVESEQKIYGEMVKLKWFTLEK